MNKMQEIINQVKETLIRASSTFSPDKMRAYQRAILEETNERSKWALETIVENANIATKRRSPLCDDTGIPHILVEIGRNRAITGEEFASIYEGIKEGLRALPGRPMAIRGSDWQRIDQSGGLYLDPAALTPAPLLTVFSDDPNMRRLHVLMLGGGPAIRGKTYRVFHKHNAQVVKDEIVDWSVDAIARLGCSPCTLAVGVGRSQYEATALMLKAQAYGNYDIQSEAELEITQRVNKSNIGCLGLHGRVSALATFMMIGAQRASGVRIVCLRPCCCFEPRHACMDF